MDTVMTTFNMGYYYRIHISVILRKDTPQNVIDIIKDHIGLKHIPEGPALMTAQELFESTPKPELIDHPFFQLPRWMSMFHPHHDLPLPHIYQHPGGYWDLQLDADINYGSEEARQFAEWIAPYVAGRKKKQYIGWYKGESHEVPTINLYVERP